MIYFRKAALVFIVALLFSQTILAQANLKEVDKYIQKASIDWEVPGMAVAIVKDGEIIFAKGFGVLEEGKNQKVNKNSLFAIASNTKAFVSASLAHLVWEKKISWDDKVVSFLPYFELYDSYTTNETTLKDILSHRTGLGTFSGDVIWYKSEYSAEEVIKHAKYVPQAYSFRAGYGYSNLMFITAGEVIDAVTGMPWDKFIESHIFKPLEMNRSVTSINSLVSLGNVASPHKTIDDVITPIAWTNWDNMGAAGGIISSVEDMSKWMILQMNNGVTGTDTIFSLAAQRDMWTPQNSFKVSARSQKNMPSKHFSAYGLGWGIWDYQGRKVVSHSGGYDGMYSRVTMIPEENLGVVVLTNSMTGVTNPVTMKAIDNILGIGNRDWSKEALPGAKKYGEYKDKRVAKRVDARVPGTAPTVEMANFSGSYFDAFFGEVKVKVENKNLVMKFENAPHLNADLSHWHFNTYKLDWKEVHAWFDFGTAQFILDNNNKVIGIEFDVPNDDIFFEEIHLKKQ